ncbi:MAG: DUF2723 domain-containing protein [Candidatus Altiarchaeota archaeon]
MDLGGRAAVLVVFAASLFFYVLTLCPTVYNGDSGDFITASYTFGVAHPTGYPLYMVVGRVFSLLPVGSVAYRYNLMSAVFAAAAAMLVCLSIRILTKSWAAGFGGGLLVAFSMALWDQATVAEAYSINGFFVALLLWLTLRWREDRGGMGLFYIALVFGLGLANHISIALYLPAFVYLALSGNRRVWGKVDLRLLAASFLAPLLLYLYLPLSALSNPVYNWGNPNTVGRFINHVTGSVHRRTYVLTLTASDIFTRFVGLIYHYLQQFSVAGVLVLVGFYRHWRKNRVFLNYTALMVAADLAYALFLNDVSLEITTFCIPSIIVLGVWSGFGFTELFKWLRSWSKDVRLQYAASAAVAALIISSNYYVSDKSGNLLAYDYGMNILRTVDQDAVIFAKGDNEVMPLNYLLLVEKVRPDVTMYEENGLLSHSLYGDDYVWLSEETHEKRRKAVELNVIERGGPVYYTSKPDTVFEGYIFRQTGLLYRVVGAGESLPDRNYWMLYDFRQVWNASIYLDYMSRDIRSVYYLRLADRYFDTNKTVAEKLLREVVSIIPDSVEVRYDLGNLLIGEGKYDDAIGEFKKALEIDPNSVKVHNNMGYTYALKGDRDAAGTEYLKALKLDPTYLKARTNLAVLLVDLGRYDDAVGQYKQAIMTDPSYAKAYFDLGLVYYNTGKPDEAALVWGEYLKLNPGDPKAGDIAGKIAEIKTNKTETV